MEFFKSIFYERSPSENCEIQKNISISVKGIIEFNWPEYPFTEITSIRYQNPLNVWCGTLWSKVLNLKVKF